MNMLFMEFVMNMLFIESFAFHYVHYIIFPLCVCLISSKVANYRPQVGEIDTCNYLTNRR